MSRDTYETFVEQLKVLDEERQAGEEEMWGRRIDFVEHISLIDRVLDRIVLSETTIQQATFEGCTFIGVSFDHSLVRRSSFKNCCFVLCSFRETRVKDVTVKNCTFLQCFESLVRGSLKPVDVEIDGEVSYSEGVLVNDSLLQLL